MCGTSPKLAQSILSEAEECGRGGTSLAKLVQERILRRGSEAERSGCLRLYSGCFRKHFILAIITLLLYAALAALYPLPVGLLRPRFTWAMQVGAHPLVALAHISIYVGLLFMYLVALSFVTRHSSFVIRRVWLGWIAFAFTLLFSFPGESADVFDYIFRGRMLAEYGLSPLVTTPYEVQNYAFHRYVSWSQWVDAYGPVWEYASAGVSMLARAQFTSDELNTLALGNQVCGQHPVLCNALTDYITAYRLFALALSAVCGALIYSIVKRERDAPTARIALLGWLWNPLVLISTAIGAHNDVLMLAFILLCVWLFQRQKFFGGLIALLLAAHIKITALVLVPVFAVWLVRRVGWARMAARVVGALLSMLPVSWLLYAPLGGWATLPKNLFERSQLSTNSLAELVFLFLRDGLGWAKFEAQQPVARLFPLAFGAVAGVFLLRWLWRHTQASRVSAIPIATSEVLRLSAVVVMLYLLIGSYWFQPWYLAWPIALAWLRPEGKLATRVLPVFASGVLVAVTLSDYLRNAAVQVLLPWQISGLVVGMMGLALVVGITKAGSRKL